MAMSGDEVRNVRFTRVTFGRGYDMHEVDELLDDVAAAADARRSLAAVVRGARFTQTRFRQGYSVREVDDLLVRLGGAPASVVASSVAVTGGHAGVVQERRGVLARLLRRR